MNKKRGAKKTFSVNKKILLIIAVAIVLLLSLYMTFFSSKTCENEDCFYSSLARCEKAVFTDLQEEASWVYKIQGVKNSNCEVYVRNTEILIEEDKRLEGKEMVCSIEKGLAIPPTSVLDNCHGILKEAMQDLIIEKLHVYIVQNIGKISSEITQPL